MLLSKANKAEEPSASEKAKEKERELADVEGFVRSRDFAGAITALQFQKKSIKHHGTKVDGGGDQQQEREIRKILWSVNGRMGHRFGVSVE